MYFYIYFLSKKLYASMINVGSLGMTTEYVSMPFTKVIRTAYRTIFPDDIIC